MEQRLRSTARALQPAHQPAGQRSGGCRRTLTGAAADDSDGGETICLRETTGDHVTEVITSTSTCMTPPMAWCKPQAGVRYRPRLPGITAGGVVPEAKAHDDFLVKHGPCGGWHPDDAATFDQALRRAYGSVAAIVVLAIGSSGGVRSKYKWTVQVDSPRDCAQLFNDLRLPFSVKCKCIV